LVTTLITLPDRSYPTCSLAPILISAHSELQYFAELQTTSLKTLSDS